MKPGLRTRFAPSFVAALLIVCPHAKAGDDAVRAEDEVAAHAAAFAQAFSQGDADAAVSLLADEYRDLNLDDEPQENVRIRERLKAFFVNHRVELEIHPEEIRIFGDRALVRGRYAQRLYPKASPAANARVSEARYVEFLERGVDGRWRSRWGIDAPLSTGPSPASANDGVLQRADASTLPERKAFDFWLGRWGVYDSRSDVRIGGSRVELRHVGHVLVENWVDARGESGMSLNAYDEHRREWRQVWMDGAGNINDFRGDFDASAQRMVLTTQEPDAKTGLQLRGIWTANSDGTVRQQFFGSRDGGRTWEPRFDAVYRPE